MVRRHACKRAYRFRLYPTPEQEQLLRRTVGCCRKVYNLALEARSVAWTAEHRSVTYVQTSAMLTQWKKTAEYSYMNEVSCVPLQQALRHLQTAFSNFFKQTGDYPRSRPNPHGGSAEYTRSAFKWDAKRNELTLPRARTIADTMVQNTAPQDGAEHRDRKLGRRPDDGTSASSWRRPSALSPPEGTQSESTWEWTATPSPATGRP